MKRRWERRDRRLVGLAVVAAAIGLCACSSSGLRAMGASIHRQECAKEVGRTDRERCLGQFAEAGRRLGR